MLLLPEVERISSSICLVKNKKTYILSTRGSILHTGSYGHTLSSLSSTIRPWMQQTDYLALWAVLCNKCMEPRTTNVAPISCLTTECKCC